MHITREERETVITWDESSDRVTIYTCSKPIMRRCEKLGFNQIDEQHLTKEDGGGLASKTFKCTRKDILIRKFKPQKLSDVERQLRAERMSNLRAVS